MSKKMLLVVKTDCLRYVWTTGKTRIILVLCEEKLQTLVVKNSTKINETRNEQQPPTSNN